GQNSPSNLSEPMAEGRRPIAERVGVRPEHIRLGGDGPLEAKVVQRQFAGASVSLRLALADGTTLTAELPGDVSAPAIGETVRVGWPADRAHVFAEGPR